MNSAAQRTVRMRAHWPGSERSGKSQQGIASPSSSMTFPSITTPLSYFCFSHPRANPTVPTLRVHAPQPSHWMTPPWRKPATIYRTVIWVFLFTDVAASGLVYFYLGVLRRCTAAEVEQLRDPHTAFPLFVSSSSTRPSGASSVV